MIETLGVSGSELELLFRVLLQCVLLSMSAFFSGSETALFSLSRIDLQKLRNSRHRHSESIHALLDEPRRLIISILCGNELVNIASAANMTAILVHVYGEEDAGWINVLVMVPMLLLFGEVTPKTVAVNFPLKFATNLSAPLLPKWILIITPLREAVRLVADRVTTFVVGVPVNRENILKVDELRTLMAEGEETGVIQASERVLIDNLLEAGETDVSRIMTPSTRIRFLHTEMPMEEVIEFFRKHRHPRIPVRQSNNESIAGFLHSEDVLRIVRGGGDLSQVNAEDLLKPAHFVPPTKKVDDMLEYFQRFNTRSALVIGEYGEVLGIVTIKDVLTFLFGEISGKMRGQEYYKEDDDNSYVVPGDMRLADFFNLTNFDVRDPLMTTLGGVTFRLFGRLPRVGEKVYYGDLEITVKGVSGLRITQVMVTRGRSPTPQEGVLDEPLALESVSMPAQEAGPGQDSEQATDGGMFSPDEPGRPDPGNPSNNDPLAPDQEETRR